MWAVRLGRNHAHQLVRLRIERRYAHRVAGVAFRLVEGAPAEERERESLGAG
jgi:hypothetical protein